jgi:uncharacterized membrane protein YesL
MNWLTAHFTREGPGVPRDAAPRHGLALLLDVVRREWWMLVQLNLLYILFALPLVTLPAAQVAASRVTALMLEDRPVYLLRDFWEAFRSRFFRATALGLGAAAAVALSGYAAFVFLQAARSNLLFAVPLAVAVSTALFATLVSAHALTLLGLRDRKLLPLIRLALLGALVRPLPVLGALAFVGLLWLAHVVFYPASVFMPAVANFSFGTLAVTFGVHEAATRLNALQSGAPAGTSAGGGAQLRVQ